MNGLPFSITRYLCGQWTERTIFIYVLISKEGLITDWSENITPFYGLKLNKEQAAEEQLVFLQGLLPFESSEPLILDSVNFNTGRSADIHIVPAENELCILLFDVTESSKLRQQLQQKSNDIELLYEQEKRSMRALNQSYKQLQRQKELAENANRAKTKFLHHINHDLKSPLNALLGFIQLLEFHEKPLDAVQKDYIQEMKNASRYILDLINELLDIAKMESGRVNIHPELLSPSAIINESINVLKPIADKNNIAFINRMNLDIPPVWIDPTRFRQIVVNFLSNAIKYNKEQGCIIVNSYIVNDAVLRINVKDTGVGIESDQLEKVFEAFERGSAEKTEIEGTGIGLNVCKQLAELMKGSVGVYSDVGLGSLFWIELPIEKENIIKPSIFESVSQNALYIDNEKVSVDLMRNLVSQCSEYQLFATDNLQNALKLIDTQIISVILIHVSVFKTEYLKMLQTLQQHPTTQKIPVIAVFDNNTSPLDIKSAMQAGFYDYMSKPFDFNLALELFDRLDAIR